MDCSTELSRLTSLISSGLMHELHNCIVLSNQCYLMGSFFAIGHSVTFRKSDGKPLIFVNHSLMLVLRMKVSSLIGTRGGWLARYPSSCSSHWRVHAVIDSYCKWWWI